MPHLQSALSSTSFPIVAIGSSAGGLEAMVEFFKNTPGDMNVGYVVVTHLSPHHVSLLPNILRQYTSMTVYQIENNQQVLPNCIYVIPPGKDLSISKGQFKVTDINLKKIPHLPIDSFLISLANEQREKAIAVILSGSGTDGSIGIKKSKDKLGLIIVQSTETAEYSGMPESAIAMGGVDYVLPVSDIPKHIMRYILYEKKNNIVDTTKNNFEKQSDLQKILQLLYSHTGHDFSLYKKNTIYRRIERRMNVRQVKSIAEYLKYMESDKREISALFNDLLIGVTFFFRDPEVFDFIKKEILPGLFKSHDSDNTIRLWIPGCSSGEEAYSYAMIIHEVMEELNRHIGVQIFATDVDEKAIDFARKGLYPPSVFADVDVKRMTRFFTEEKGLYKVKNSIREMIVFAPQNLIKDPPFTRMDLISCRNVLIYFGVKLQRKVLSLFNYSLNPNGVLVLGPSETVGKSLNVFQYINKKWKIFKNIDKDKKTTPLLDFTGTLPMYESLDQNENISSENIAEISSSQLVETILKQTSNPPSIVINSSGDILYIHGNVERYIELVEGKITTNIIDMARPGIKRILAKAVKSVSTNNNNYYYKDIKVQSREGYSIVDLSVKAILDQPHLRGMMIVIFDDSTYISSLKDKSDGKVKGRKHKDKSIEELELELKNTREDLQITIEELETSNEELKSTNEELQSTNEELQSTNEEIETSKEELQSLNEESATMNEELQCRIKNLSKSNDDMSNYLNSTNIATIFLDLDLKVQRFTIQATEIVPLTKSDIGRPISDFSINIKQHDLINDSKKVLQDLQKIERRVETTSQEDFLMRIQPYRTTSNVVEGVVINFVDVSELVQMSEDLKASKIALNFSENIINTVHEPFLILDSSLYIIQANKSYCDFFNTNKENTVGHNLDEVNSGQWDISELKKLLRGITEDNSEFSKFKVILNSSVKETVEVQLNAKMVRNSTDSKRFILLAFEPMPLAS